MRTISRKLQYLKEVQMKTIKNKKQGVKMAKSKAHKQSRKLSVAELLEGRGGIPDGLDSRY